MGGYRQFQVGKKIKEGELENLCCATRPRRRRRRRRRRAILESLMAPTRWYVRVLRRCSVGRSWAHINHFRRGPCCGRRAGGQKAGRVRHFCSVLFERVLTELSYSGQWKKGRARSVLVLLHSIRSFFRVTVLCSTLLTVLIGATVGDTLKCAPSINPLPLVKRRRKHSNNSSSSEQEINGGVRQLHSVTIPKKDDDDDDDVNVHSS